jgi:hypothetical protein
MPRFARIPRSKSKIWATAKQMGLLGVSTHSSKTICAKVRILPLNVVGQVDCSEIRNT